jgi:hypothetical protein
MSGRTLPLVILLLVLTVPRATGPVYATLAPVRVAVLPTRAEVYVWGWRPDFVVTSLLEETVASAGAILAERSRLDALLPEQILARAGVTDPQGLTRLGGLLGVDLLVLSAVVEASMHPVGMAWSPIGSLQVWSGTLGLVVRLVSAADGRILFTRFVRSEVQAIEVRATVGGVTVGASVPESLLLDQSARDAIAQIRNDIVRALAIDRR